MNEFCFGTTSACVHKLGSERMSLEGGGEVRSILSSEKMRLVDPRFEAKCHTKCKFIVYKGFKC